MTAAARTTIKAAIDAAARKQLEGRGNPRPAGEALDTSHLTPWIPQMQLPKELRRGTDPIAYLAEVA
jgi:hypothetical protein